MHPGACCGTLVHTENDEGVLDNEGGPRIFLYVVDSTIVSDSLPALIGVLPCYEFMG